MARMRRWNWLLQALAAALLAIGLRLAPIGEHWQRSLWDHLVATWRGSDPSGEVVLVAIDTASIGRFGRWPWPAARTHRLLDAIADLGAREIVCTFEPPADFDATGHHPPVRPRDYRFRPFDPDNPIEPTARAGTERGLSWIPVEGQVRSLPLAVRLRTEGWSPSLLGTALARRFGAADTAALAAPDVPFGRAEMRFGARRFPVQVDGAIARLPLSTPQRAGSVPTVSAARLLDGELDGSGVLRGRTVVLGPTDPSCARLYPVLGARDVPSSEPELWAAGLDAALSGRLLHWQPPAPAAVWLVLGLLVLSILLRQTGPAPGALLSIGVLLAVYAASVGAVRQGTLLETLPWYAGVLGLYGALQLERASGALRGERELAREIERTDRRLVPPRADADRWQAALAMADQFLETDSLVLLRLEPESGRLHVFATHRCGPADIAERRRDPQRSPYREAADPLRQVVRTDFLRPERRASSLLVPLIAVTRLLGFLVINRRVGTEERFAEQRELIDFVAGQIATSLHREALAAGAPGRGRQLLGLLARERLAASHAALAARVRAALDGKNLLLETLDAIEDAVALADLFGSVLYYNRPLAAIAEQAGIRIEGRALLDLLVDLTGAERDELVRQLSDVVGGRSFERECRPIANSNRRYRFVLGAVRGEHGSVLGIVALLSDITALKQLDQMKTNLLSMVSYRVLNMLASIQGYAELLEEAAGLDAEEREFASAIRQQAAGLSHVFDAVHVMAGMDLNGGGLRLVPLDLVELIEQVFRQAQQSLEEHEVQLALETPQRFDIVAADRDMIEQALLAVTRFSIENAEPGSTLRVCIVEEERYLRIDVVNRGYGLPDELLEQLFEAGDTKETERRSLARVKQVFELHGGTAKAEGEVGRGLRFHLWLPLFMKGVGAS